MHIKPFLFPALVVISLAQGCSFSASSQSSSDSSASSSDSSASIISSPSSSSSEDKKDYQLQVMNYTSTYITSSEFDRSTYVRGIAEIATAQGITNWEDDEATLIGIGRGLKKSKITGQLYETYKGNIAGANINRMQMIQKGYEQQED
ncbi:MAG: putative lipoprotein [Methyloprofundus sp.]|nr:putative lipoprotein [Methyloprofundus sp.]